MQNVLPGFDAQPVQPQRPPPNIPKDWIDRVRGALRERSPQAARLAADGLREFPDHPHLLLLASLTSLAEQSPEAALVHLKRFQKRYGFQTPAALLRALAIAQQGEVRLAWTILKGAGVASIYTAPYSFIGAGVMDDWLRRELLRIRREATREKSAPKLERKPVASQKLRPPQGKAADISPKPAVPDLPPLPRLDAAFETRFEFANPEAIRLDGNGADADWFRLRGELIRLGLLEGYDELLCLPVLRDVETHWYQVETVRKVLKQFRGRVLLADEVGLGKTIEAGMIVKEYMLRGMAERVLILAPASLVGQWRDEMSGKFGIECATSYDPLLRSDPQAFWAQPLVIASIAAARRREHAEILAHQSYDVLVVDEAHHLRDQASASYRLVNGIQKRFLLLLSATPVQNNLLELYHLLTLLQPGIFKTPREFRAAYMTPGKPREPINRERLRDLMRGVMVRNTRALAALRLPRRHASTIRAAPDAAEAQCYQELTALGRELAAAGQHRLSVQHLLAAAGSSPAAAAAAIGRFSERHTGDPRWETLARRYREISAGAKQAALLKLLAQNPSEKKMVFVHHRDSIAHLAALLRRQGSPLAVFEGGMSGPEKDAAVAAFRDSVPLFLCSESGGEGRNLQFCNTLLNFDIPWNPMAIEQRIGRIDRIGQTREVFVFNLVTTGSIEEAVLRILDEKINMFELVVGEVGAILGELDEQQDFSTMILDAWLQTTEEARESAFAALGGQLVAARREYEDAKELDDVLFGDALEAA
jgi:superfamily II DNA or RNA helicase